MKAIREVTINKLHFPIDNIYNYHVAINTSVDGGKTFWYCGMGEYCRTLEDAETAKANFLKEATK